MLPRAERTLSVSALFRGGFALWLPLQFVTAQASKYMHVVGLLPGDANHNNSPFVFKTCSEVTYRIDQWVK